MQTKSYQDLIVWQKGMGLVEVIYNITAKFPREEMYGLVSQMRRVVVSIVSNIAEGYSRQHLGEYVQFLAIVYGSCAELSTQILVAKRLQFITQEETSSCESILDEIQRMLYTMIQRMQSKR